MNKIVLFVLDLFFPNRCPICNGIIAYNEFVCRECICKLETCRTVKNAHCEVCGKLVCKTHDKLYYSRTVSAYYYEGYAKSGIISLKTGNKNFGNFVGEVLASEIMLDDVLKNADFVTAVPMSKHKYRQRGYNQADVMARAVSRITGIPVLENALFRKKSVAQHTLKAAERRMNIFAFYSGDMDLSGKTIILCDDVLTTGSTMNRCAELLINMNAGHVYVAAATIKK